MMSVSLDDDEVRLRRVTFVFLLTHQCQSIQLTHRKAFLKTRLYYVLQNEKYFLRKQIFAVSRNNKVFSTI